MENKNYYVYEWIRLDTNEPFYVGKGKGNRAFVTIRNNHFNNILKKVGIENVAVVFLHENLPEQEALELECWYIHEYKYMLGFNLAQYTDGGEGVAGYKHTKEARYKISRNNGIVRLSKLGKHPMSGNGHLVSGEKSGRYGKPAWNRGKCGEEASMWGKKHTEETKKKMSEAAKGRKLPDEVKLSISKKLKGRSLPQEVREKMSKSKSNGKVHNSKPILVYKDGVFYNEYPSFRAFAKEYGTSPGNVANLVKGWVPKYGKLVGFTAKYK